MEKEIVIMRWILVFIFLYVIPLVVLFKNYKKFSRACIYACTYVVLATTIVISNMYISGIKQLENNNSMVMNYKEIYTSSLDVNNVEQDLLKIKQYKSDISDIENMALPPCHALFQFYVANGKLSCQLYQRSADTFLGVPFNIASYALLTMMMAQVCGLKPGEFVHTLGDTHIYLNHIEQVKLQLTREPRPLPRMEINPDVKSIFDFKYEDFTLCDYNPHPHIKGAISV